jgi:hypothetical protein
VPRVPVSAWKKWCHPEGVGRHLWAPETETGYQAEPRNLPLASGFGIRDEGDVISGVP